MYKILLDAIMPRMNWSLTNVTNFYNFIISTFEIIPEDKKKLYVSNIKLTIGLSFIRNLKMYLYEKDPDNELLKYL